MNPDSLTAASLGYRMPAEWETHACVWLSEPASPETWPGCLEPAQQQFDHWRRRMQQYVSLRTTQQCSIPTDDAWIRDFGPLFVVHDHPTKTLPPVAAHDFRFNTWGNKYEPRPRDDAAAAQIIHQLDIPHWTHPHVLEGGAIDVNGRGTLLTTESCLLNPNRHATSLASAQNPAKRDVEQLLAATLNTPHIIWLKAGITGDDTDGHIDDIARFINPTTVVAARAPQSHPDHEVLEANWNILQHAIDQDGQPLELLELPMPEPIYYDYPADRWGPATRDIIPASYANFLICNGAVFVPIFDQHADDRALRTLDNAMPQHTIEPIPAQHLAVGLGTLHCLSMQQPAGGTVES